MPRRYRIDRYDLLEEATLEYFRELSKIGSVAGTEYRVLNWLLRAALPEFVSARSNVARKLNARFTAGNQLLVSWNGLPEAKQRLLLVAHTDHEGFIGRNAFLEDVGLGSSLWVYAEDPSGESIEEWHKGAHVHVVFDSAGCDERVDGIIEKVIKVASQSSAVKCDYAMIRVLSNPSEDLQALCERIKNSTWPVIVYPNFKFKEELTTEGEIWTRNQLEAPFVDNYAGVAVVTAVLQALIDEDVPANVSVLYTTGEEAGFVGLLTMVAGIDDELQSTFEDAVWLVIDASSQESSSQTGLQDWYSRRVKGGDDSVRLGLNSERCPPDVVSIRLEDWYTLFDYSAALLLYQASFRVKSRLFNNKAPNEWHWQKHIGVAGEFVGGVSEGMVLAHYNKIRRYLGKSELIRPPRIGALAIPIINYRNYAGFNAEGIKPEITRVGALASAAFILFEACCIADRTYLGEQVHARGRDENTLRELIRTQCLDRNQIEEFEEMYLKPIDMFLRYFERGKDLLKPLNHWVDTEGQELLKGLLQ